MKKYHTNQRVMASQLEAIFERLRVLPGLTQRPVKGWIQSIRQALGMTTEQLGRRVGVNQSRISRIEQDEVEDAVTLRTMKEAASALDCDFVYFIVPRESIKSILEMRARKIAERHLAYVIETMALEDQEPSAQAIEQERQRIIEDLLAGNPKHLWEE